MAAKMHVKCNCCGYELDTLNYIELEDEFGWVKIGQWPNYQFICFVCAAKPFREVVEKIDGKRSTMPQDQLEAAMKISL